MIETVRAWLITIVCVIVALMVVFTVLPRILNHWDKERAQTRIEVKDMDAVADAMRTQKVQDAVSGNRQVLRR